MSSSDTLVNLQLQWALHADNRLYSAIVHVLAYWRCSKLENGDELWRFLESIKSHRVTPSALVRRWNCLPMYRVLAAHSRLKLSLATRAVLHTQKEVLHTEARGSSLHSIGDCESASVTMPLNGVYLLKLPNLNK